MPPARGRARAGPPTAAEAVTRSVSVARALVLLLGLLFLAGAAAAAWIGPWGAGIVAFAFACSFLLSAAAMAPAAPRGATSVQETDDRRYARECRLAAASCACFAVGCTVITVVDPSAGPVGVLGAVSFGIGAVALVLIARAPSPLPTSNGAPG